MQIILLFLIITFFSIFFILIGISLNINFLFKSSTSKSLQYSLSYFIGLSVFLSFWKINSYLIENAVFSFYLTIILCLFFIYYFGYDILLTIYQNFKFKRKYIYILALFFIIYIFEIIYWLPPFQKLYSFSSIGSLHSPRYGNIASYIIDYNRIPIIGQNFGQSILTSIPMILGINRSLIALNFWLSTSMVFFTIMIYSLFRFFQLNKLNSIIGSVVLLFGNTAISFVHILVIDSGSPFICNGYVDSITSIGTFVQFFFYINRIYLDKQYYKITFKDYFLLFALSIHWNISSPQNIFFGIVLLIFFILKDFKELKLKHSALLKVFAIFALFNIFGITQGGMFTPSALKNDVNIPGVLNISDKKSINLSIGLPYYFGFAGGWENGLYLQNTNNLIINVFEKPNTSLTSKIIKSIYLIEQNIENSFKIIFWPFFGILSLFYFVKNPKLSNNYNSKYKLFIIFSFITLLIGYFIAYFIEISGYKWELSRFLILGYFFGMTSLVLFLFNIYNRGYLCRISTILSLFLVLIGPIINISSIIFLNITRSSYYGNFVDRLFLIFNYSEIII